MLKGILGGGFMGIVLMGVSLGTASLVAEQPAGTAPPDAPDVDAPGIATARPDRPASPDLPARVADAGGAPQPSDTPQVGIETDAVPAPLSPGATAPAATPDAAQSTAGLAPPARETDGTVSATAETPVLPNPLAAPPVVPVPEADVRLEVTTPPLPEPEPVIVAVEDPAPEGVPEEGPLPDEDTAIAVIIEEEPIDPEAAETGADEGPVDEVTSIDPDATVEPAPNGDPAAEAPESADEVQAEEATPETASAEGADVPEEVEAPVVAEAEPEAVVVLNEPDVEAPEVSAVDGAIPEDTAPTETAPAGTATDEVAPDVAAAPVVVDEAPAAPSGPRIALRGDEVTLPGGDSGIRVIRPEDEVAVAAPVEPEADVTERPDAPALERFAEPLNNPDGRPLMSVILIDDGSLSGAVPAVAGIPFDLTVAIDPASPGSADRMAAYRAAGIEVVALANVAQGATPADAEVALEAAFSQLPEAVALLDAGDTGLQEDRDLVDQAMARLAEDGRGFITAAQGLNSGLRAAEAASVPGGLIYRDLDSDGQTAQVIRRFLDQAAFRARQQSGVILLGRVRADTLSALTLWGSANRAGQVTLAPISATLTGQ